MKLDLLNRVITAAALVALAITLGVWLTRSPLTAAPSPPLAKPVPHAKAMPEPALAPLPLPAPAIPTTVTTELAIECEIAPLPSPPTPAVAAPPAAEPASPQCGCQYYYRRGWFRRR